MVDESGQYLQNAARNYTPGDLTSTILRRGEGLSGKAWSTGKTVTVSDYQNCKIKIQNREFVEQAGVVPIIIANKVVGVLGVIHNSSVPAIEDQKDILEQFAHLVAIAIENVHLHEETNQELIRTEAINELSHATHSTNDFTQLLDHACVMMVSGFRVCRAEIIRYEEPDNFTPIVAWESCGGDITRAQNADKIVTAGSIAKWCIKSRQPAFINRGVRDPHECSQAYKIRE